MRVAVVHNRDTEGVINVFGPQNRERYNPRTVELVASALERGGHTVRVIDGNMHVIEQLQDFMPRVISGEHPGMVFNMAYGIQGVSRYTHLPAMLEMLGIPYVGSGPQAHAMALDKVVAKMVFSTSGLPTPKFWNFATADEQFDDLEYPLIVKPKMEAVSYGIRIVDNEADLRSAVANIIDEFQQHVLVEQFIAGREFAIGLLGNGDPEVLPIVEIDLEGDPDAIQSADEKLRAPRGKLCPAPLDPQQAEELREVSRRAFRALGLFDFARVDLRMDADGRPYILEINSMASLGRTGTYVHAAQTAGYSYDQMVNRMLDIAAMRYFGPTVDLSADATRPARRESTSSRIRTYLRTQHTTIEESLRRMVNLRTPPTEQENIAAMGDWLSGQLRHLGFSLQRIPRVDRADILYLRNHTDDHNDVLLLGHCDTGAPADQFVPYREDGTRIHGTGVAEGKGGIAVAIAALRALRYVRRLRAIRVGILLTTDATLSGEAAHDLIRTISQDSRHVIGLQAGDRDGSVITSRSGRASFRVRSAGRRRQREVSPAEVVEHFCGRVVALQSAFVKDPEIRVAVTSMELAAQFGRLPHFAEAAITVRFNQPDGANAIESSVRRIAESRAKPGLRLAVRGGLRRPPWVATENDAQLLEAVRLIASELDLPVAASHRWASADICAADGGAARLDGLGPLGGNARTDEEYILRHSLVDRAALLALTIRHCARPTDPAPAKEKPPSA